MKTKTLTLEQYIEYRNKLVTRRDARSRNFPEKNHYYNIRLQQLDEQYPQFRGIGHIELKNVTKPVSAYVQNKFKAGLNKDIQDLSKVESKSQELKLKSEALKSSINFKSKHLYES